jgi:hypothetical protein
VSKYWSWWEGFVPIYVSRHESRTVPYSRLTTKMVTQTDNGGIYSNLKFLYQDATRAGQPVPPEFTTITSNFNQLNQMISGVSSSIQMQMQYLNQNLQQFFGIYKSFFDDYSQLSSYVIQKTNSQ